VGRAYTFPFVPSGFFGRVIVRVLNSLSITNFALSGASQSGFASSAFSSSPTAAAASSSLDSSSPTSPHSAIQVLWANGLVLRVSRYERALIEFDPHRFRLQLHYRYAAGTVTKPGKPWAQVVAAITNVISEWYQIPAIIDAICPHCLEQGRGLDPESAPPSALLPPSSIADTEEQGEEERGMSLLPTRATTFKFTQCEMEYYKGHKTIDCVRRRARSAGTDTEAPVPTLHIDSPSEGKEQGMLGESSSLPSSLSLSSVASLRATSSSSNLATASVSMVKDRISPRREFKERGRSTTLSATNLLSVNKKAKKKDRKKEEANKEKPKEKKRGSLKGTSSLMAANDLHSIAQHDSPHGLPLSPHMSHDLAKPVARNHHEVGARQEKRSLSSHPPQCTSDLLSEAEDDGANPLAARRS
jgi:hypothetical protein